MCQEKFRVVILEIFHKFPNQFTYTILYEQTYFSFTLTSVTIHDCNQCWIKIKNFVKTNRFDFFYLQSQFTKFLHV